jgi:hypothetical protein
MKLEETLKEQELRVQLFKKRMLEWENPVEYVNNMYGCHPGEDGTDYFEKIYSD